MIAMAHFHLFDAFAGYWHSSANRTGHNITFLNYCGILAFRFRNKDPRNDGQN